MTVDRGHLPARAPTTAIGTRRRSTTRQIERATEYAARKDWTVDSRYIFVADAMSGAE
jgi:hypothetical protein